MKKVCCALMLAVLAPSAAKADSVIMDNTAGGTAFLTNNLSALSATTWAAKIIATPSGDASNLSKVTMSLYNTLGTAATTITISLRAVDGSNNPTGADLAQASFNLDLTTTPAFYTFTLNSGEWGLAADTTYALVVSASAASGSTSWTRAGVGDDDVGNPYVMAGGFTFLGTRRTLTSGSSWSGNGYNNGLQLRIVSDPGFNGWSGGQPVTDELLVKYAIGGADSPSAPSAPTITQVDGDELSMTVILRTNDPDLSVVGEAVDDIVSGAWTTAGVTMRGAANGVNQDGVPAGCERRIYSTEIDGDEEKFLRLVIILE